MTERDPLADLLRRHDGPVDPSPAFADRLEARLLAELRPAASVAAARSSGAMPMPISGRPRRLDGPVVTRRTRWFDVAAAAVLLLSLMGGVLTQLDGRRGLTDSPTAVAAPRLLTSTGEEPPVTSFGSSARDNRWSGPGLSAGALTERWTVPIGGEGTNGEPTTVVQAVPYGGMVFSTRLALNDPQNTVGYALSIEVRSLESGALVWSRQPDVRGLITVAEAGVVAVISTGNPETSTTATSSLALLDRTTGSERWRHALPDGPVEGDWSPVVVDGTVYYADSSATVYALDLVDGTERWVSTVASVPVAGVWDGCNAPVIACLSGVFAVGPDTLYVTNSKAELVALDLMDGAERWTVDVAARYGIPDRAYIVPTAVARGVVVAISRFVPSSEDGTEERHLALLDGDDGSEEWRTEPAGNAALSVVADEDRVYLLSRSGTTSLSTVDAYDLATGTTLWRSLEEYSYPLGMLGDGRLYVGTGRDEAGHTSGIASLDPATGTRVGVWQVAVGTPSLATGDDGTLLVSGDTSLTAFSPSSSAVAAEPAVMEGGSAARDNRYGGPALGEGELVERWVAPDPEMNGTQLVHLQVAPYGDMVYRVVGNGTMDAGASRFTLGDFAVYGYRLNTGELIWSHVTAAVPVAVTAAGVVAVVPTQPGPDGVVQSRLALLDAATGAEVWSHDLAIVGGVNRRSPIVDGDTVYYVDVDATVYALDLATGSVRWVSRAASAPATDAAPCLRGPGICGFGGFAIGDGALYVFNAADDLVALDLSDGTLRWQVDVAVRYGVRARPIALPTAVPGGVVLDIVVDATDPETRTQEGRFVRLDGATGADVWERRVTAMIGFAAVSDGERLFVGQSDAFGGCCAIVALDLATGETVWTSEATRVYPLATVGGDLLAVLSGSGMSGNQLLMGLDPATGQERWRQRVPAGTPSLPLAHDGTMLVDASGFPGAPTGLFAYLPASAMGEGATPTADEAATPAAAGAAKADELAVMDGGSAARDNRWAGPAPVAGSLEARWSAKLTDGQLLPGVVPFGDLVYAVIPSADTTDARIEARDLATGELRWSVAAEAASSLPTVSAAGVLLLDIGPGAADGDPLVRRLRMLDLTTGEERWRHEVGPVTASLLQGPIVAGGTVYHVGAEGVAYALDAETGAERWVSRASRTFPTAETMDCAAPAEVCGRGAFAYRDGVLYLVNSAAEVYALDAGSGSTIWKVDVGERYGLLRASVTLMATERGVVVNIVLPAEEPDAYGILQPAGYRTALLDRGTGDEVWTRDDVADLMDASSDGERLFARNVPLTATCCAVVALDLATGRTVWTLDTDEAFGYPLGIVGGDDPVLVRVDGRHEAQVFLVGLDPATGEERWRLETDQDYPSLPLAADGTLFALESDGTLTAFTLVPDAVVAATPVASPAASPESTPAGRGPGVPSTAGSFSPDHAVSAGQDVNLRSEPTTAAGGATVVEVISDGTPLRATGRTAPADDPDNGPWVEVQLEDGTVGWLRAINVSRIDA